MKKLTSIIATIICMVVIISGCGNAPANAGENQPEAVTQQSETVTPTAEPEAAETPDATETPEVTETPSETVDVGYEISRWTIRDSGGSASLVHQFGPDRNKDVEEVFVFDSDSGIDAGECTVIDVNESEDLFLLNQHRDFFTFNLNTHELKCIVDTYLDYRYDDEAGKIHYAGLDYYEKIIDWQNPDSVEETGIFFVNFFQNDKFAEKNEEFNDRFLEIQAAVYNGADPSEFTDVEVLDNGDIYDLNGKYLGNLHLPYAFDRSQNLQYDADGMMIMIEDERLVLYRYGEAVKFFNLPTPGWRILGAYIVYGSDPADVYSYNPSALDLYSEIEYYKVILLSTTENSLWAVEEGYGIQQIAMNCVDYQEYNGVLYWMDFSYTGYTLSYQMFNDSMPVMQDVVAVAHYPDERVGFVLRPDDSRANAEEDGLAMFRPE